MFFRLKILDLIILVINFGLYVLSLSFQIEIFWYLKKIVKLVYIKIY